MVFAEGRKVTSLCSGTSHNFQREASSGPTRNADSSKSILRVRSASAPTRKSVLNM